MNSALAVRPAIATPSILHLPPGDLNHDAADEAIEWGECYSLTLDADQRATLHAALAETTPGVWAASEVGDFKGRQAGKNDTLKVRQGAGVDLFGERLIIHTAHEWPTAKEDFLRLVAVYEAYDDLRKTVAHIRYGNGENALEFLSGARILYRARTGGAGRGFAEADLVVYDESQHLKAEHLAASLPTTLVSRNSQAWYSGSGGLDFSAVAWALRRRAILADGSAMAYTENTAQVFTVANGKIELSVPDDLISEESLLTHPGYANGRVTRAKMESLFRQLGPERFGREILCIWDPEPDTDNDGPIDLERWAELAEGDSTPEPGTERIALSAPPDRASAVFAIAGQRADKLAHVAVRFRLKARTANDDNDPGLLRDRVIEAAKALTDGHSTKLILPHGDPARAWRSELIAAGVELDELSSAEFAEACGAISTKVEDGALRHPNQPDLNTAVAGLSVRRSGDVDVWSRRTSSANIAPFVAATCALVRVPEETKSKKIEAAFAVT